MVSDDGKPVSFASGMFSMNSLSSFLALPMVSALGSAALTGICLTGAEIVLKRVPSRV